MLFLERAKKVLGEKHFVIEHVDAVGSTEKPKLGPHFPKMREALAKARSGGAEKIHLKAKTNEGVDAIGRGEAIAAHVVATWVSRGSVKLRLSGARHAARQVALLLLDGGALTSERFKEIVTALKDGMELRGRELFHPIRLALAGRAGEGELDRVILLLDEAAELSFAAPVKSARARILEFCTVLD